MEKKNLLHAQVERPKSAAELPKCSGAQAASEQRAQVLGA
jgi:hypothetical protein